MIFFFLLTVFLVAIRHFINFEVAELVAFAIIITVELEKASIDLKKSENTED